ncbi:MAG TPA: FtsW/RodA/SpoVE family cell cycle protein, partial [bacterium]|nr:FtsW/RodA/SpoVE family cell cycle protein [bacterium]
MKKEERTSRVRSEKRRKPHKRVPPPTKKVAVNDDGTSRYESVDVVLLLICILLTCIGILMVTSASGMFSLEKFQSGYHYLWKELAYVGMSAVGIFVMYTIDYRLYKKYVLYIMGAVVILLILVLIPGVGVKINEARRWIRIGGLMYQVGELAKLATIIFMAVMLDSAGKHVKEPRTLLIAFGVVMVLGILLLKEPDFGMVMIISIITISMLYVAGARVSHLLTALGLGAGGAVMLILTSQYKMARINGFLHPDEHATGSGYQTLQSLIAIASGGV